MSCDYVTETANATGECALLDRLPAFEQFLILNHGGCVSFEIGEWDGRVCSITSWVERPLVVVVAAEDSLFGLCHLIGKVENTFGVGSNPSQWVWLLSRQTVGWLIGMGFEDFGRGECMDAVVGMKLYGVEIIIWVIVAEGYANNSSRFKVRVDFDEYDFVLLMQVRCVIGTIQAEAVHVECTVVMEFKCRSRRKECVEFEAVGT